MIKLNCFLLVLLILAHTKKVDPTRLKKFDTKLPTGDDDKPIENDPEDPVEEVNTNSMDCKGRIFKGVKLVINLNSKSEAPIFKLRCGKKLNNLTYNFTSWNSTPIELQALVKFNAAHEMVCPEGSLISGFEMQTNAAKEVRFSFTCGQTEKTLECAAESTAIANKKKASDSPSRNKAVVWNIKPQKGVLGYSSIMFQYDLEILSSTSKLNWYSRICKKGKGERNNDKEKRNNRKEIMKEKAAKEAEMSFDEIAQGMVETPILPTEPVQ